MTRNKAGGSSVEFIFKAEGLLQLLFFYPQLDIVGES